jgi:hypothetical protein
MIRPCPLFKVALAHQVELFIYFRHEPTFTYSLGMIISSLGVNQVVAFSPDLMTSLSSQSSASHYFTFWPRVGFKCSAI